MLDAHTLDGHQISLHQGVNHPHEFQQGKHCRIEKPAEIRKGDSLLTQRYLTLINYLTPMLDAHTLDGHQISLRQG